MERYLAENLIEKTKTQIVEVGIKAAQYSVITIMAGLYYGSGVYEAIGGRFSRKIRENAIQFWQEEAFFNGDDMRDNWVLRFWSKKDRRDAILQIDDAFEWKGARDKFFDDMSDEEMEKYVGGHIAAFQEGIRPMVELPDRRN